MPGNVGTSRKRIEDLEFLIASIDDLQPIVDKVLEQLPTGGIVLLTGEIGAGKTTLVQAICKRLGVQTPVTSPTFSLVNEYHFSRPNHSPGVVFHIDLYRIEEPEELHQIGLDEYLYDGDYCFLEWPEIAADFLPEDVLRVHLEHVSDHERKIQIALEG